MQIKIVTDSSSDLPLSYVKERSEHLEVLGMPVTVSGQEYIDDLGESFSHSFFYEEMAKGTMPKTSQINVVTFYECFERLTKEGKGVLYLGLSSGLSGTYNNAVIAKSMVLEENPNAQIAILDSLAASIGLGVLVYTVVEKNVKENLNLDALVKYVEGEKLKANHWFVVDDLLHLKNGGRIPATTAYVGTVLSVKPLLSMNHTGKLETFGKVRGKTRACKYIISKISEHLEDSEETVIIGHANTPEDAAYLVQELKKANVNNPVILTCLSATIASHVGPGMLAVAFMGKQMRENK
jgi:DegV family protein with EDD domain